MFWMMDNYKLKYVVGNSYYKFVKKENVVNVWGLWDLNKFIVEDFVFGFIIMENGVMIVLEVSWVFNIFDVGEVRIFLLGIEGGVDMEDGL